MYRYSNGQISLADFKQPIGMNLKEDVRDWYFVHYNPFGYFTMVQSEGLHVIYLSMKKLREICGKYPSKDRIFLQYMQFLDEQTSKIKTTMRKPMK